jgi:hypothetical protein
VCWRLNGRWREENYFRHARTRFALDALDSHAASPDDPGRLVPNPAKKAAAAQVRRAETLTAAAEAERDARLLELRRATLAVPGVSHRTDERISPRSLISQQEDHSPNLLSMRAVRRNAPRAPPAARISR